MNTNLWQPLLNTDKDMDQKQPVPFEMDLKPEVASGVYSNFVLISHSPSEIENEIAWRMRD